MVAQPVAAGRQEGKLLTPRIKRFAVTAVAGMMLATASGAQACAGARGQRLAVEFAVLALRVHRLETPGPDTRSRARLRAKLGSALGVLPLLARSCLGESGQKPDRTLLPEVLQLQRLYGRGQLSALAVHLRRLGRRYPVDTRGLLPLPADAAALRMGHVLYRNLCMGCHSFPDPRSPVPAPDLFALARTLSATGLVASLVNGVRGTSGTTLVNPLDNQSIADLAAYLRAGRLSGHQAAR